MNTQSRSINGKGKKAYLSSIAFALVVELGLVFWCPVVMATSNPIPGVDIIVKKRPGGKIINIDASSGEFTVQMKEPGKYTVSVSCKQKGGCAPYTVSINASGVPLKPSAKGVTSYDFTVGDREAVVLSGQIQGVAGAATVIDQKPIDATPTTDANSALQEVSTTRSNIKPPSVINEPLKPADNTAPLTKGTNK